MGRGGPGQARCGPGLWQQVQEQARDGGVSFGEALRMLAHITGTVDQELLLRNEYLAAENQILRAQLTGRLLLSDAERATLGEIGHRLGRKALEDVANTAKPDTILGWYRRLMAWGCWILTGVTIPSTQIFSLGMPASLAA